MNQVIEQKLIKNKLGLLKLAQPLDNVSKACKGRGFSRESFYRFKELYDQGGDAAGVEFAVDPPAYGQQRGANELKKRGISVSAHGVRSIWWRHDLETFAKRLKALSAKVAQEGLILTEDPVRALEKAKEEKQAPGEMETEHPGYLGAQDTYYGGHIKGVGRISQQTFIDTDCKGAPVKLYDRKHAIGAADRLTDRVRPWFEQPGLPLLRLLTDRGAEYCGNREHHEYELSLDWENIEHTRPKTQSPQTNGIWERFHQTIQNEFYAHAFRRKLYRSLDELQADVEEWRQTYNEPRPPSGKYCFGKTPMQTLIDSRQWALNRQWAQLYDGANSRPSLQTL